MIVELMAPSKRGYIGIAAILAAAMGSAVQGGGTRPELAPRSATRPPASQRLNTALFQLDTGGWVQRQTARLNVLCAAGPSSACRTAQRSLVVRRVLTVRAAPRLSASIVGYIDVVMTFSPTKIAFAFCPIGSRPQRRVWVSDIGDWGYGLYESGVRVRGDWIQLVGPAFTTASWIKARAHGLYAEGSSIQGDLLRLRAMRASFPDGTQRPVAADVYLIERIRQGVVFFRKEIATDMPCGEDVTAPAVMPPLLHAPAAEFFDPDGTPRFAVEYTKGC